MVQRKKLCLVLDFRHINPHIQITKAVQFHSLQQGIFYVLNLQNILAKVSILEHTIFVLEPPLMQLTPQTNVPNSAVNKYVGWKSAKSKFCCIKDSEAALMHIYYFFFTRLAVLYYWQFVVLETTM